MSFDKEMRSHMVALGAALYNRGLTPGRTGNLSVRVGDKIMITPTNACLGRLDPERLAITSLDGEHIEGDKPSKELVLHQALYRNHPMCAAVAHLHSTSAVAVSCLPDLDVRDALPPLTPYFVMRVGRLPVVDYAAPGSAELKDAFAQASEHSRAVLLRHHGSLVTASTLDGAVDAVEEIEETARLHLLLEGRSPKYLEKDAVTDLHRRFPQTP
jgi:ribulose-5-phosphate 4-epimerase/fuculose-1-phosphate aldolase